MSSFARWWAFALALVAFAAPARAQELSERRIGVHWEDGVPRLDFSAADLADRAVRHRLQSGLPQTLLMRVYAYRRGGGDPIAVAPRSCRVVYDLWEEVYRVEVQDSEVDTTVRTRDLTRVLRRCLTGQRMPVGVAGDYSAASNVYFAVLIELNPMSPDTVHRMRRWLSGGGREAFFGSFVSLFVNRRIGSAERTLRFRSQDAAVVR
jgi:hypothetical protein